MDIRRLVVSLCLLTAACAHHRFVNWQEFVSWWDGDVLSFLARQGVQ